MKNLFFVALVLFTSNVFAAQPACNMSMGREWSLCVFASGEDFGEVGTRGNDYDREPTKRMAYESAYVAMNNQVTACALVCQRNGGTFSTEKVSKQCSFDANFPHSWNCMARAEVSCQ